MVDMAYDVVSSELLSLEESHPWNTFFILFQQPTDFGVEYRFKLMGRQAGHPPRMQI